ncbi:MAG: MFS transporter, partial [Hyphomicrobium sp.]
PTEVNLTCPLDRNDKKSEPGYSALFQPHNRRATVLAAVPWFFQDLATYGIGIFTPTILASAFGHISGHTRNVSGLILHDILAAKGAALIDTLLIVGIICAVILTDKIGRIRLQILGFIGCAVGLLLATISLDVAGTTSTALLFAGFMLFNFMTNIGPNAQTYLLAGEVFPTKIRGRGAGSAAAFAKIAAVLTAVLFPILMADIGTKALLYGLVATSLIGAAITYRFRIETTGVNLEKIGR